MRLALLTLVLLSACGPDIEQSTDSGPAAIQATAPESGVSGAGASGVPSVPVVAANPTDACTVAECTGPELPQPEASDPSPVEETVGPEQLQGQFRNESVLGRELGPESRDLTFAH